MKGKRVDERLWGEMQKVIAVFVVIQNLFLVGALVYQKITGNVSWSEVMDFNNPLFMAAFIFLVPFMLITVMYETKNNDEDRHSHVKTAVVSMFVGVVVALGLFMMDGQMGWANWLIVLVAAAFNFIYQEFINFFRFK